MIFVKQLTRNSSTILWKNMHMELIKILTRKQKTSNFIQTRKLPPFENNFLKQEAPFYSQQRVILHFLKTYILDKTKFNFWIVFTKYESYNSPHFLLKPYDKLEGKIFTWRKWWLVDFFSVKWIIVINVDISTIRF